MVFQRASSRYDGPTLEADVLEFWRENQVFEKTLINSEGRPLFTFNEGPPTANARPGIHHVLPRTFNDIYPRYKTMRGFLCATEGRLGYPRPASRTRNRERTGHLRQTRNRNTNRDRRIYPTLSRVCYALYRRLGKNDRADGFLGGS